MTTATQVYNTFTDSIQDALLIVAGNYFASNLDWFRKAQLHKGQIGENITLPAVAFSASNAEEAVFQSGIYKVTCALTMRFDLDAKAGALLQIKQLSAACQDVLQLTNLVALLNATGLVVVNGTVMGPQALNDFGDRYAERIFDVDVFGFSVTPS